MDPTWVFQSKLIPKNRTSLEWWMRKSICCFWREDRLRSNIFEHMTRVPGVKSWNPSQNWTSDGSPIFLEYETPSVIDDIIVTWETAEMNASDRPRCPKMCLADGLMPYLLRGRCSDSTICWWRTYHNMIRLLPGPSNLSDKIQILRWYSLTIISHFAAPGFAVVHGT